MEYNKPDYSKITLCPALNYDVYCQVCGKCEYCPYFHTNKGEKCKGCGANFKHAPNPKERFINSFEKTDVRGQKIKKYCT